jgi:Permuted papain-like amidase enzyme, YaeF/YiiX, C92 family
MNFILKKMTDRRWPLRCLLFFVMACHVNSHYDTSIASKTDSIMEEQKINAALETIYSNKKMVKQGDLIVRTGRDFASEIMRQLSARDKTYSHCGIASIEHDSVFVYHSIGGEWNPDQKLRRDPFEIFCNPFENRGFGIFRYSLNPEENAGLRTVVQKFYTQGIMFDMQFDLASDERMYCTEFVYKAVEMASHRKIGLSTTTLNHIKFVTPDNLFMNSACIEIKRVIFNR